MAPTRFTIRIYGILINKERQILLSHEKIGDFEFTKFPGGGLEFGEGPKDCLVREFKEETGIDIIAGRHVYTCDYFIQSKLDPEEQVIGIYYLVKAADDAQLQKLKPGREIHDFRGQKNEIRHEWLDLKEFNPEMLTFEMDRRAYLVVEA
jgi:8-oxo-dGTP diphosphatase